MFESSWKKHIKNLLATKRMSARALAHAAGLSTSTVHDMLNKPNFQPQVRSLEKVLGVLGARLEIVDDSQDQIRTWINDRGFTEMTFLELEQLSSFCAQIGPDNALNLLDRKVNTYTDLRKVLIALS